MNVAIRDSSPAAEALMSQVLRGGEPLAQEYPLVFEGAFGGRVVTLEGDDERVLSACAILQRELVVETHRFRVGLIGSVATDPGQRRRGYGSEVLASSERELAASGCLFALLWADEPDYYERRGYVKVGAEDVFLVARSAAPLLPPPNGARPARTGDVPTLHELYSDHPVRVDRSPDEAAALFASPGVRTAVLERDGSVVAYACMGRGVDLPNTIHEWAGPPQDVLALVRSHLESVEGDDSVVVMLPPSAGEMRRRLEVARIPGARGVLGMAKLTDPLEAARLLESVAGPDARVVPAGDGVRVEGPEGALELSARDTLLTLFPPMAEPGVLEVIAVQTGLALVGLPLTPYVWGLDSI